MSLQSEEKQIPKRLIAIVAGVILVGVLVTAVILSNRSQATPGPVETQEPLATPDNTIIFPEEGGAPIPVNCNAWAVAKSFGPGDVIEGPASIHPFAATAELATALQLDWRENWGIRVPGPDTTTIPDTVIDRQSGEPITLDGIVRYYGSNSDLRIAEYSNFDDLCK